MGLRTARFVGGNLLQILCFVLVRWGWWLLRVSSGRSYSGGHSLLSRVLHSLFEMEARLKADVIVVKVSGLMPCARASGYASTGRLWPWEGCYMYRISFRASASGVLLSFSPWVWRRPHLRSQVSCSSSWYQSYGSWVDLLAFKELVLWFWKARGVDGFSGVIAFYEPASRHSSHPGTVVFYGGVADFLAGFGTAFQDVAV